MATHLPQLKEEFLIYNLLSLSMIFTVAVSLRNSPALSTAGIMPLNEGLNVNEIVSSYSRVISSSVMNSRMSVVLPVTMVSGKASKSVVAYGESKTFEFIDIRLLLANTH